MQTWFGSYVAVVQTNIVMAFAQTLDDDEKHRHQHSAEQSKHYRDVQTETSRRTAYNGDEAIAT